MAEIKFSCPSCHQSIKCDELWVGHQIQCPSCQNNLTVPQVQAAPAPAPAAPVVRTVPTQVRGSAVQVPPPLASAQPRLSLGRPQHAPASEPGAAAPVKSGPVYRNYVADNAKKSGGPMKWVAIAVVLVAVGVGGYFGFGWLSEYQEKANEKRRAIEKDSDGGQVGHIANLYDVLDATENGGIEPIGRGGSTAPRQSRSGSAGGALRDDDDPDNTKPRTAANDLPVIPAVWTLDLKAAKIPDGRANGKISGTNFVVQTARLDYAGTTPVLSLRQGTGLSPDREILVYLRLKPGEQLSGHTWTVTKDMKGASVPQISKRWKTNPRYAPTQKNFPTGYAMRLELGQISDGEVTGKIFVALPDPEQTVVGGIFTAGTTLPDSGTPGAVNPAAAPNQPPASNPEFEARYGIKR